MKHKGQRKEEKSFQTRCLPWNLTLLFKLSHFHLGSCRGLECALPKLEIVQELAWCWWVFRGVKQPHLLCVSTEEESGHSAPSLERSAPGSSVFTAQPGTGSWSSCSQSGSQLCSAGCTSGHQPVQQLHWSSLGDFTGILWDVLGFSVDIF